MNETVRSEPLIKVKSRAKRQNVGLKRFWKPCFTANEFVSKKGVEGADAKSDFVWVHCVGVLFWLRIRSPQSNKTRPMRTSGASAWLSV